MMKRSELSLMALQIPLDFLLLLLAGVSAYALRFTGWAIHLKPVLFRLTLGQYFSIIIPIAAFWIVIFACAGLYSIDPNRKLWPDLERVALGCSAGLAGVALYIMFTQGIFDSRFLAAASWGFAMLYVGLGRVAMRGIKGVLYRRGIGARRVVVVGHHGAAEQIIDTLRHRRELGYQILGQYVHFDDAARAEIERTAPDEILFTNPRAHEAETLSAIEFCHEHHIVFKYSADLFDTFSTNMTVSPLAGIPIVEIRRTPLEGWGRVVKRLFDIIVSAVILIGLSPLLLVISLMILFETGRPALYKNERVGRRGKKFFTLKFRSMEQKDCTGPQFGDLGRAAEEREQALIRTNSIKDGPIYKIANDPRVTPLGRWLRRWSIDELPQFFNVLRGEMSIVGPRPHQPREVAKYDAPHRQVLTLKPGVTGLAQISGRSDLSFEDEVRLDVFYVEHWTPWLDIIICIKTPFILFKKRKAL